MQSEPLIILRNLQKAHLHDVRVKTASPLRAGGNPHTKLHRLWLLQLRPDQVHDSQSQGLPPARREEIVLRCLEPLPTAKALSVRSAALMIPEFSFSDSGWFAERHQSLGMRENLGV